MRKSEMLAFGIILLSFLIAAYLYPRMPEKIASHWGMAGEVNGYLDKFWGLFLLPLISVVLLLLFAFIPRADPMKANIEGFRKYYDGFVVLMVLFLFYIYLLTVFWNMGFRFSMPQFLAPAFAILFYCCGILVENAKRNWFVGIRTPWTMSSEKVWDKTHELGGKLFKGAGVIALLGIFLPSYAIFLVIIPVILVAACSFAYSYVEYQNEMKAGSPAAKRVRHR